MCSIGLLSPSCFLGVLGLPCLSLPICLPARLGLLYLAARCQTPLHLLRSMSLLFSSYSSYSLLALTPNIRISFSLTSPSITFNGGVLFPAACRRKGSLQSNHPHPFATFDKAVSSRIPRYRNESRYNRFWIFDSHRDTVGDGGCADRDHGRQRSGRLETSRLMICGVGGEYIPRL